MSRPVSAGITRGATLGASLGLALLLSSCGLLPATPEGPSATQTQSGTPPSSGPPSFGPPSSGAPSSGPPSSGPPSSGAPSSGTPTSGSPGAEGPAPGWTTFTTVEGGLSFDHPAGWAVKDPGGALGGEFVDVFNAAGKPMAGLRTNIVTGAECMGKTPFEVFDSEPMVALAEGGGADGGVPRYVFESRGDDPDPVATRSTIAAYGITMVPEETGDLACPMFHLFLWPPSGAFFGGTYDPEHNQTPGDPALPYLDKARLYASTAEYRDVRTMITSLRPAGALAAPSGR